MLENTYNCVSNPICKNGDNSFKDNIFPSLKIICTEGLLAFWENTNYSLCTTQRKAYMFRSESLGFCTVLGIRYSLNRH